MPTTRSLICSLAWLVGLVACTISLLSILFFQQHGKIKILVFWWPRRVVQHDTKIIMMVPLCYFILMYDHSVLLHFDVWPQPTVLAEQALRTLKQPSSIVLVCRYVYIFWRLHTILLFCLTPTLTITYCNSAYLLHHANTIEMHIQCAVDSIHFWCTLQQASLWKSL